MKVSYQRELYRSQMRCELEGEESRYGYPLQMCLRNSIPGLLPCSAEPVDGRIYICWDITSRNSLKELSGGGMTLELLERVLRAVYAIMRELEGYLVNSGYLVLLPEQIYLDASRKKVEFVCDYEDEASFRAGIQKLAEYVLAGIDHKDPEQMRLGYGLYRLAVQENFSREEFQRLLFGKTKQAEDYAARASGRGQAFEPDTEYSMASFQEKCKYSNALSEDAVAKDIERQKILDSFFKEDEEEKQGIEGYLVVYVLLVALAVCGLEIVFYFRNRHHIHPAWLVFGLLLTALCAGAACVGWHIKNRGKEISEEVRGKKRSYANRRVDIGNNMQAAPGYGEPASYNVPPLQEAVSCERSGDTMVLQDSRPYREEECMAILESMEQGSGRFIVPANGAVLGKLPEVADIILPSPAVSRIHARITRQGEEYFIQDLNSRNGTRVNGRTLASQQFVQLKGQDEISFADLSYRFLVEDGNQSQEPDSVTVLPKAELL